jgi:phosphoribosylformimino-5-aminoimidazole carboxamide ribotide isomerase
MGAPRIHIVDLDAAGDSGRNNLDIVRDIARVVLVPTQLGGGMRDLDTIQQVLRMGIERVILGTAAVEDPVLVKEACRRFNDYITVSLDARDGMLATHGWQRETRFEVTDVARRLVSIGAKRFIYTDIVRDGTLTEPNFTAISALIHAVRAPVVAAGGISSLLHLKMLKQLGAEGAIIGKALYTGDIDLKQALKAVEG